MKGSNGSNPTNSDNIVFSSPNDTLFTLFNPKIAFDPLPQRQLSHVLHSAPPRAGRQPAVLRRTWLKKENPWPWVFPGMECSFLLIFPYFSYQTSPFLSTKSSEKCFGRPATSSIPPQAWPASTGSRPQIGTEWLAALTIYSTLARLYPFGFSRS